MTGGLFDLSINSFLRTWMGKASKPQQEDTSDVFKVYQAILWWETNIFAQGENAPFAKVHYESEI